jgi:AbrB family looped-hinge helix DNA binding protein
MSGSVSFLTVDKKGRATLPEAVRESLGVSAGDIVLLEETDRGTFELVPAALVPREQLWFHHASMKRRLSAAEADISTGRASRAATPEDARVLLDSLKKRPRRHR